MAATSHMGGISANLRMSKTMKAFMSFNLGRNSLLWQ